MPSQAHAWRAGPADEDALAIDCPQCGQPVGHLCLDYSSRSSFWLHVRDIPPNVLYAVSRVAHRERKAARAAAKQARVDALLDEVVERAFHGVPPDVEARVREQVAMGAGA